MKVVQAFILLLCNLALGQIATQTVNDAYFSFHGGTNRIQPQGSPTLRGSSFGWHLYNPDGDKVLIYLNEVEQTQYDEPGGYGTCNIAKAWTIQSHASNIIVAIVDDSFDLAHPDLEGRWWINPATGCPGVRISGGVESSNVNVSAAQYHGTMSAGIIGAIGNNQIGIAGVCKDGVQIMPIASAGATDDMARGVLWAATNGAKVILFPYGTFTQRTTWTNAFVVAQERGCLVVQAVQEGGTHDIGGEFSTFVVKDYPAMWGRPLATNIIIVSNLITVTCSRMDEIRYSVGGWSTQFVDCIYPGRRIPSLYPTSDYAAYNGTSPAAAIAAGHAALLWERFRNESFIEIKERILSNTTQNAVYSTNCLTGQPDVFRSMIWNRPTGQTRRIR